MKYVYFGTPQFAATILDELLVAGFAPALIVTAPDKPAGRKLLLTPSAVKLWGEAAHIPVITPERLKSEEVVQKLREADADVFIVAAYGKIIPQTILDLPKHGTLNIHPSLLPLLRGPSPIESAIAGMHRETGVSIMLLDAAMDHGPIILQEKYPLTWEPTDPPRGSVLEDALAHQGGKMLAKILPEWTMGKISSHEQNHDAATFCKKITKEDGHIDLSGDPLMNIAKIRAYDAWPGTFFFVKHGEREIRVRITEAHIEDGKLVIDRVIPEGKKEMNHADFLRGIK